MSKIFINNAEVYLTAQQITDLPNTSPNILTVTYKNLNDLLEIIRYVEKSKTLEKVYIIGTDYEQLKKDFYSHYHIVESAGGLVTNPNGEVLLMYRKNKWDLPKGKIEPNETHTEGALREVIEETAVQPIVIQYDIPILTTPNTQFNNVTFHCFHTKKGRVLKTTYWYAMYCSEFVAGVPQIEEDITELKWVKINELDSYFNNMYSSIKDVIRAWLACQKVNI